MKFNLEKYYSTSGEKAEILTFNTPRAPLSASYPDEKTIHAFNWPHSCCDMKPISSIIQIDTVQDGTMDVGYFQNLLNDHPYEKPLFFKRKASLDGKFFKEGQLNKMIADFRKIMFPSVEDDVLNTFYCKTLDPKIEDKLDFFQGKGEIIDKKGNVQKYVIFATKFSLRVAAKSKQWYLDGTFKVTPSKYYQVYIWLAKYEETNLPCVYILMTGKSELLYNMAFSHVKNLFSAHKYEIQTEYAILDFEKGSRCGLRSVFPQLVIRDCYFHYCQCLWRRAQKNKLFEESIFKDTVLLIAFLKLFVHIDKDQRKELFSSIKSYFLEKEKAFKSFLEYFEANWLENIFIEFKGLEKESLADRTNNVSEGFNSILNKHIGIYRPSLALFVSKLKDLEIHYRKKTLLSIGQGASDTIINTSLEEKLPFTQIYNLLQGNENEIVETVYNLCSNKKNLIS